MIDIANGYAILRAAFCDAELWFQFRMNVNDAIGRIKTDIIKDKIIRTATENYVKALVNILPKDKNFDKQSGQHIMGYIGNAYATYAEALYSRYALEEYGEATEKDMERYMEIKQFIPNYDSIYDLRRKQSEENERYLLIDGRTNAEL